MSAQGRMAEVIGTDAIAADVQMRTWGYWRHAQLAAENLDAEHLGLLQAYADGVNAYVAAHEDELPAALDQIGIEVQTWTPAHSLAVWYRFANFFANDPSSKALRYEQFTADVEELGLDAALAELYGPQHGGNPDAAVVKADDVPDDVEQATLAYAGSLGYGPMAAPSPHGFAGTAPHVYGHETPKFSHTWAVAGSRTTTGDAVLVSDPQVPLMMPNLVYEFAIDGATIHARGATAPGMPGLLIGFTPAIAWGLTAAALDQRDLFALDMTDATHYLVDGEEHEIETETETIAVKGGDDVSVEYRKSLWGPVVTAAIADDVREEYALKGIPFSEPDRDTFVGMVAMMRAEDLDSFRAAIEDWRFPSANIVVAAKGGDVFYTVLGAIPVRSLQSPAGGMIAQDGSSTMYDWLDIIPGEFKPWVSNPSEGYIYSANHRVVDEWYPLPLGVGVGAVGDTVRSRNLRDLLAALPAEVTPQQVLDQVQFDCASSARRDLALLGHHVRAIDSTLLGPASHATLDALVDFSDAGAQMLTDQPGVGTAYAMSLKFRPEQTGDVLAEQYGGGESGLGMFLDDMMAQIAADPGFVPSPETIAYLDFVLSEAAPPGSPEDVDAGYADYAATKTMALFEAPDAAIDLGESYTTPTMVCADGSTIWSQGGETYTQWVDLASVDDSVSVMPPGIREDQNDPWATSQVDAWISGAYKPAPLSADAVDALAADRYTLKYP
jgi:penicillin amidase